MSDERQGRALQLRRLQRLTDVVYALVIWRLFVLIPRPGEEGFGDSVTAFLRGNVLAFVLILIGLTFTIIYWIQNNNLMSRLEATDGRHTVLSIWQIFLLLIFLYSLRLGIDLGGSPGTRAFESVAAALVGFAAGAAWHYAKKNRRLLRDDVSDAEANALADRTMAEPLAAIITLPFCFMPILWECAWLSYPIVARLLRRKRRKHASQ